MAIAAVDLVLEQEFAQAVEYFTPFRGATRPIESLLELFDRSHGERLEHLAEDVLARAGSCSRNSERCPSLVGIDLKGTGRRPGAERLQRLLERVPLRGQASGVLIS